MRKRLLALAAGLLTAVPPLAPQACLPSVMAQTAQSNRRLVVLPFENLSRAAEDEWLREGFADSLTLSLARVASLQLIERTRIDAVIKEIGFGQSAMADQGSAPQLGKLYGAQLVALGSFQRVGEQIRISVRLVDVETGTIQAQSITQVEGTRAELFGLQQRLGEQLSQKLAAGQPIAPAPAAETTSPAAQEAYIKGFLALQNQGSEARLNAAFSLLSEAIRLDPQHARAHAGLAEAYLQRSYLHEPESAARRSDRSLAGEQAQTAVRLAPNLAAGHIALGRWLLTQNQDQLAQTSLETALRIEPGNSQAILLMLKLRAPQNIKDLRQELERLQADLDDPWIQIELVEAYYSQKYQQPDLDLSPAHELLKQAALRLPDFFFIPFYQGTLAYQAGDYSQAISYLKHSYALEANYYASFILAHCYLNLNQPEEARSWLAKTRELNPNHGGVYYTEGQLLNSQGDYAGAYKAYEKAHQLMPSNPDVLVGMAWVKRHQEQLPEAQRLMKQALSIAEPGSLSQARIKMMSGELAFDLDDLATAEQIFKSLEQDARIRAEILPRLAHLASSKQDYAKARGYYASFMQEYPDLAALPYHQSFYRSYYLQEQLLKKPDDANLLNDLGQIALEFKRFKLAEDYLGRALKLAPDNPVILYNAGSLALQQQRWADATKLLEQATLLRPDYTKAWYNLALARQAQNQATQARVALERVLAIDPAHTEASKLLQSLKP